jgi:hypothetical protein
MGVDVRQGGEATVMRWFGKRPFALACEDIARADTPFGIPCCWCSENIEAGDEGFLIPHIGAGGVTEQPLHQECQLRSIIGGVNHLAGNCSCCGGREPPDPEGLSRREAAREAVLFWEKGARN